MSLVVLGVLTNLVSIYVLSRRELTNTFNHLLIVLAVFDILYLCLAFVDCVGVCSGLPCDLLTSSCCRSCVSSLHKRRAARLVRAAHSLHSLPGQGRQDSALSRQDIVLFPGDIYDLLHLHDDLHRRGEIHGGLLSILKVRFLRFYSCHFHFPA